MIAPPGMQAARPPQAPAGFGRVEQDLTVTEGAGMNLASAFDRSEQLRGAVVFGFFQPTALDSRSDREVTVSSLAGARAGCVSG